MSDLKNKETPREIRNREIILLVQRQTGYTEDIAKEKLKQYNNNYIDVIKSYVNPEYKLVKNKEASKNTTNQQIFSEIRGFMDGVNKGYEQRKAMEEARKTQYQKMVSNFNIKIASRIKYAKTKWSDAPDSCWTSQEVIKLIMKYKFDDNEGIAGKTFFEYTFKPVKEE